MERGLESKANTIAANLFKYCIEPDGGKRVRETGSISPASTLKNRKAREAFSWANLLNRSKTRYFTQAGVRLGIMKLLENYDVQVPIVPGLPFELWLTQQSKVILHMCKRARKNSLASLRFLGYRQSSMDWTDTIPMEAGLVIWPHASRSIDGFSCFQT